MSEHNVTINWHKQTESFAYKDYNRSHTWDFGEGLVVPGSSAPEFLGDPEHADPERAFAAAISSCHLLFVIAICSKKRLVVQNYTDRATSFLETGENGNLIISKVILRPKVTFAEGVEVSQEVLAKIHQQAHDKCFLAQSVKSDVIVDAIYS